MVASFDLNIIFKRVRLYDKGPNVNKEMADSVVALNTRNKCGSICDILESSRRPPQKCVHIWSKIIEKGFRPEGILLP